MTRETKIGLVVGASFLSLVAGVVTVRFLHPPGKDATAQVVANPPKIDLPADMDPPTEPAAPGPIVPVPATPGPTAGPPPAITLQLPSDSESLGRAAAKTGTDGVELPKLSPPVSLDPPPARPIEPLPVSPVITIAGLDSVPAAPKPKSEVPTAGPVLAKSDPTKTTPMNGDPMLEPPPLLTAPLPPSPPSEIKVEPTRPDPSKPAVSPELKAPAPLPPDTGLTIGDAKPPDPKSEAPKPTVSIAPEPISMPKTDPNATKLEPPPAIKPAPAATPPADLASPGARLGTPTPAGPIDSRASAPATVSAAQPDPKQDSYEEEWYRCQASDTLETICQKYTLSPKYAQALRLYNLDRQFSENLRQDNPVLRAGQIIRVPEKRILERNSSGSNPAAGSPGRPATSNSGYDDVNSLPEYTVPRANMTLQDIAKEQLGSSSYWFKIYELNRWLTSDAPVPPGTKIHMPRPTARP